MTVGFALSGGGARGDFQLGAIEFLYEKGIRPDVIAGTSVGSINGAKLAEGEGGPTQGLAGLKALWGGLTGNSSMWSVAPWAAANPSLAQRLVDYAAGEDVSLDTRPPYAPTAINVRSALLDPIGFTAGVFNGLLSDLQWAGRVGATAQDLWQLGASLLAGESILTLAPIEALLRGNPTAGVTPALDPAKVRAWAENAGGRPRALRLAMVGLSSGALRYVTETGAMIERDGSPVVQPVSACAPQEAAVRAAWDAKRQFLADLGGLSRGRVPAQALQQLDERIRAATDALAACRAHPTGSQQTVANLADAVLASASIACVFRPVAIGEDRYIDGGHREIVPIQAALDAGADDVWAISCSPLEIDPPPPGERYATIAEIGARAMVDIHLDEIKVGDLVSVTPDPPAVAPSAPPASVQPITRPGVVTRRDDIRVPLTPIADRLPTISRVPARAGGPTVRIIAPRLFDRQLHNLLKIDPGLIRISRDYGYMAAADVYHGASDPVRATADNITIARVTAWRLENRYLDPAWPVPLSTRRAALADLPVVKSQVRSWVEQRRAAGGVLAAGDEAWSQGWEAHPWTPPIAVFWSTVPPTQDQCAGFATALAQLRAQLSSLQADLKELDPTDRQAIGKVAAKIASVRNAIADTTDRAHAVGCPA